MTNNNLEKTLWTENDFETMQWHDCKIYAVAFNDQEFKLIFDIDYILEWVNPKEGESYFKFWVVPATLVFRNVYSLNIVLQSVDFQIQDILRDNPVKPRNEGYAKGDNEYEWTIETTNGQITFRSIGYNQYARGKPKLLDTQFIGIKERNGILLNM